MNKALCVLACFTLAAPAIALPVYQQWRLEQEREVEEGVYARLVFDAQGWRVWRFEARDWTSCKAVKSAIGRPHPFPLGVRDALGVGTPFLSIDYQSIISRQWTLRGEGLGPRGEYRRAGDRFWSPVGAEMRQLNGQRVEVHVISWEYPELSVGRYDERGVIDLTGLDEAIEAAERCISSDD